MNETTESLRFTASDFALVTSGSRASRWNDTVRVGMHTLKPHITEAVEKVLIPYLSRWGIMLSEQHFSAVELTDTNKDDTDVEAWLRRHSAETDRQVVVLYLGQSEGYLVDWTIFCSHWVHFCYPGDDMLICPVTEDWVLYFYHEEIFYWGQPTYKAGRMLS